MILNYYFTEYRNGLVVDLHVYCNGYLHEYRKGLADYMTDCDNVDRLFA